MKTFSQIRLEQAITLITDEDKPIKSLDIRCPYCGDSKRNPSKTHMGVKLSYPTAYHCFICDESGSVGTRFLKDVGVDNEVIKKWAKYRKTHAYRSAPSIKEVSFHRGSYDYQFKYDTDSKQYKYLADRFKLDFSEEDIKRFKIILNPVSFLRSLSNAKGREIKAAINLKDYIGFLTQDGNQAVFRAVNKDVEPRFYNLTIEETDYRKLYVINNEVDVKADKFAFVLTEGIFDLISVYMHFYKDSEALSNTIFVAGLGKSFQEPINRLVQTGFLDFDVFLFSDSSSDIDISFYENLLSNPYLDEFYVATNKKEGEKDFGVSLDRIEFDDFELFNQRKINRLRANEKYKREKEKYSKKKA